MPIFSANSTGVPVAILDINESIRLNRLRYLIRDMFKIFNAAIQIYENILIELSKFYKIFNKVSEKRRE